MEFARLGVGEAVGEAFSRIIAKKKPYLFNIYHFVRQDRKPTFHSCIGNHPIPVSCSV